MPAVRVHALCLSHVAKFHWLTAAGCVTLALSFTRTGPPAITHASPRCLPPRSQDPWLLDLGARRASGR
eukprot:3918040-Pleurochrysis_carterae.AAC.1